MKIRPFALHSIVCRSVILFVLLLAGLALSACGGARRSATLTPTRRPSETPTPRSTPLPTLETPVPLAVEGNPLIVLMLPQAIQTGAMLEPSATPTLELPTATPEPTTPPGTGTPGTDAPASPTDGATDIAGLPPEEALAIMLTERTGFVVDVQLVNSYGEIITQLCGSVPVVGWIDGFSYVVAAAQGCASPALIVERNGALGDRVDILAASAVRSLDNQTVCRIDSQDVVSWFVPSLVMYAEGVNPLDDLAGIVEVADYDGIVAAIYNRDCDAGAVPHDYLDDVGPEVAALEDLEGEVSVFTSSPVLPYNMMVYAPGVPLNVRAAMQDAFVDIAHSGAEQGAGVLHLILQQDDVLRFSQGAAQAQLDEFLAFMNASDLNFATMGE